MPYVDIVKSGGSTGSDLQRCLEYMHHKCNEKGGELGLNGCGASWGEREVGRGVALEHGWLKVRALRYITSLRRTRLLIPKERQVLRKEPGARGPMVRGPGAVTPQPWGPWPRHRPWFPHL